MIELIPKVAFYKFTKATYMTPPLPMNYTLGLTYKCQSRCATCRVWERKSYEMNPEEWEIIFKNIGKSPYWVTFTGGEPFLYKDITEVFYHLTRICKPKMVNIPTNGQSKRIEREVWDMCKLAPDVELTVNVSLDHYNPERNDKIRGLPGYFKNAFSTLAKLQDIESLLPNLNVGIHTVISKHNVSDFPEIGYVLSKFLPKPENYITEIAEGRVELGTTELDITPDREQYRTAIESLITEKPGIKQAFRRRYYRNVCQILDRKKTIPCYAGYSSCQITPDGNIWMCCIKSQSIGNLRGNSYNFKKLWRGDKAREIREINRECFCPMANVSYTNMLMHPKTALGIVRELI